MAARHDEQPGVGKEAGHALAEHLELDIAGADEDSGRHPQLTQPPPQRLHLARSDSAQHGGHAVRAIARLVGASERAHLRRVFGEHRLRTPAVHEVSDRAVFDFVCQAAVGVAALGALYGIVDARRSRYQHEPHDPLWGGQGHMQRDTPAHRIAREHEALGTALQHAPHAPVERDRTRRIGQLAVSLEVERQRSIAFHRQMPLNPLPGTACPGEPVQQDNILTHA